MDIDYATLTPPHSWKFKYKVFFREVARNALIVLLVVFSFVMAQHQAYMFLECTCDDLLFAPETNPKPLQ